jgi:succinoglycan biosynthesis transport protein ExoP
VEPSTELDISKYVRLIYTKRVLFVLTVMMVTTVLVLAVYLRPKLYEAKSIIFIERNVINDLIKNVAITPSFADRTKPFSIAMKNKSFLMTVLGELGLDVKNKSAGDLESLIRSFQDMTDIRIEMNTANRQDMDLIIVSYADRDPKLACNYVNTLVRRYIEDNLSMKRKEVTGANRFLLEQINLFKKKLGKIDVELAKFQKDKGAIRKERLVVMQKKLNELLMQYNEKHPDVIKVKAEIEQLIEQTKVKKGDPASSPIAGMNDAADIEQSENGRNVDGALPASDMSAGNKGLLDLEREREINKRIYEELLANLGKSQFSTQVEVQGKADAFRIVEPAIIPTKPINRNIMKMILLGILGGIAVGLGVVIGLDLFDTSLRSVDAVKKLGLPVLAIIPIIQTVQEATRIRRKDRLLYTAVGVYVTGLMVVVMVEMMGLPYVDNFVQGAQAEIKSSVKRIW